MAPMVTEREPGVFNSGLNCSEFLFHRAISLIESYLDRDPKLVPSPRFHVGRSAIQPLGPNPPPAGPRLRWLAAAEAWMDFRGGPIDLDML
ncbi:MAG: hypothetical protein ACLQGV_04825 [Bryobacteraceae bacterium]